MIRKAAVRDVKEIKDLVNAYAEKGEMLPRALGELYDSLRDFIVYEEAGKVIGVAALHIGWEGIAEVRSLAVRPGFTGRGVGSALVKSCLDDARALGAGEVFVLTYAEGFFAMLGFKAAKKEDLPQKIWTECRNKCVKYPDSCNETALMMPLF